ncbi:MAG: hypothetical protein IJL92_03970 [Thermoguttaceae bacterium]|nr:hypothetical protein [Thermoguttaceae bacterium]
MQTLYILSLSAAAIGGASFWGILYYVATCSSRSASRPETRSAAPNDRAAEERIVVYEFVEFDSDSSF